jgi:mannosyltransferase
MAPLPESRIQPVSTLAFPPRRRYFSSDSYYTLIMLTVIFLAGMTLRLYQLSTRSLWFDEAFSWRLVQFPWYELLPRVGQDNHPPLYFILLKAWAAVFGDSVFALRSLSVLFGVLTIFGAYLFAVEAFGGTTADQRARGRGIGLLAAALIAGSAFQIRYSQEVRMYTQAGCLALFSSWALLRALSPPSRLHRWLLYGVLALLLAYTHYYALFTLAAQAVFVIGFLLVRGEWSLSAICRGATFRHASLVALLVTVCFLPWLPMFLRQRAQVQKTYWTPPANRWNIALVCYQLFVPSAEGANVPVPRSLQLLAADLCLLGLWVLRRKARTGEWFVITATLVPVLLALLVTAHDTRVIGAPRFFLMVHLFLLVGLAALVWRLPFLERTIVVIALLAASLGISVDFWNTTDVAHKPGARAAAEYISSRRRPGEPVVVSFTLFYLAVRYHAQQRDGIYLYSDGSPIPHHHGSAALTPDDRITEEQLRSLTSRRVWVVEMAGGSWGMRMVPVTSDWKEKERATFPEVFGLGNILVIEYETKKPENENR